LVADAFDLFHSTSFLWLTVDTTERVDALYLPSGLTGPFSGKHTWKGGKVPGGESHI
jgi:hypothetical protein